jgi:hypothetical protein
MSIEKPEPGLLVIHCDMCDEFIEFSRDEGQPTDDPAACLRLAKEVGWKSEKQVGFDWSHYCEDCAPAAAAEAKREREANQERERIRQHNASR